MVATLCSILTLLNRLDQRIMNLRSSDQTLQSNPCRYWIRCSARSSSILEVDEKAWTRAHRQPNALIVAEFIRFIKFTESMGEIIHNLELEDAS